MRRSIACGAYTLSITARTASGKVGGLYRLERGALAAAGAPPRESARRGARQEKVRDQRCRPAGAALAGSGQVGGARDVEVRPLQSLGELAEEGRGGDG